MWLCVYAWFMFIVSLISSHFSFMLTLHNVYILRDIFVVFFNSKCIWLYFDIIVRTLYFVLEIESWKVLDCFLDYNALFTCYSSKNLKAGILISPF